MKGKEFEAGGEARGRLKRRSGEGVLRRVGVYKDLPEAS